MKAFRMIFKTESKLVLRCMDSIIFGVFFPVGMAIILGLIYGNKPAYEGANFTFIEQSFGAIISIGICATGLMGIPLTVADYRHNKLLKRFKVTPVSPALLLIVQVSIQFIIATISSLLVFGIVALFFEYQMFGSLGAFLLSYLLVTMTIYGIGMMLASVAPNIKTANLLCTLVYFPMLFLSGATIPYEIMPKVMQKVTDFFPLTQGIKLLKGVSLGTDIGNMMFPIILMIALTIISILISFKSFRWE